jgi:hypothetical protein
MSHGESTGTEASTSGFDYASTFVSTPSGTNSAVREVTGAESSEQAESHPEDGRTRILKELEKSVASFRDGKTPKTDAIASVLRILGENSDVTLTRSQKEAAFDSYLTEILSIQSAFDKSPGRASGARVESVNQRPHEANLVDTRPASRKARGSTEPESDDEDDKPAKRQKLLESDMPWYSDPCIAPPISRYSHPSCEETCRLLRAYNLDITKAKFYIKIAPNSPAGIPSSQWERILKGDSVDLNHIFASLHHVVSDEERTGRLGETEITFGVAEAKKRVSSAAEWSTTWKRASKAIGFAFPHRREELSDYGDYIKSEFSAKLPSSHHKLILYDAALRNEVAAGQHVLLTDHGKFSRLYSAIVLPDGVEGNAGKTAGKESSKSRQGDGKPETCNKFNAGTCQKLDGSCKYRHVCKKCHKPGHGKKDCQDGAK